MPVPDRALCVRETAVDRLHECEADRSVRLGMGVVERVDRLELHWSEHVLADGMRLRLERLAFERVHHGRRLDTVDQPFPIDKFRVAALEREDPRPDRDVVVLFLIVG